MSIESRNRFLPEEIVEWERNGFLEKQSESKPGLVKRLPWSHMQERQNHDLIPNVSKITMPILIVVGEKDTSIPPDQQEILFNAIPSVHKEIHVIKDAPHTFRDPSHLDQLKNIFDKWLKSF